MKKTQKILASMVIVLLVFFAVFVPNRTQANFFTDDDKEDSKIEKTIDNDDGGIFEKIIAKMIGGIAETVLNLTTSEEFGMGFKKYDELIFAKNSTAISPFTAQQWSTMMYFYKVMSAIAGSLILIAVVVVAYKLITGSYSIERRNEAKDSLLRLFFGAISIVAAPLLVKFLLFLNNNMVHILVGYSNGSLDDLLGNEVLSNISTGNAIATAIVIAMFAYLFFKLNIKFIIRQFTILIFTLFTPIVAIMWMMNRKTIGASLWFGQIFINVFMQFIYAFLFLIYMNFLPQSGGWAVSLLWAMMILPLADALGNTLQNLVSRVAGIDNDELANRGIGMAGAMAHSVRAITYQFKNSDGNLSNSSDLLVRLFNKNDRNNTISPMQTNKMETTAMNTKTINTTNNTTKEKETEKNSILNSKQNNTFGKVALNVGKELLNTGMYMADGKNFGSQKELYRLENQRYKKQENEKNTITNIKEQEKP